MTGLARPPSRQPRHATSALALRSLRARFGPCVSIQQVDRHGVTGARVLLREGGQTFVLSTCLSGAPEDRPMLAALWALKDGRQ